MLFIGVLVLVLLAILFSRLPTWLNSFFISLFFLLTIALANYGGLERTIVLALFSAIGLSILMPATPTESARSYVRSRKVPKRRHRRLSKSKTTLSLSDTLTEEVEIPGYEVIGKVGSGGMASVFKAKRKSDGQIVALKVPMEQYVADAKFVRRFHREAEVALRLNHQNIVRTFEHGSQGVKHFMAMELLEGRSLEEYIENDELTLNAKIGIMKLVVGALEHIHEAGIVHRDIKPANIMILKGGIRLNEDPVVQPHAVKLMDFGIAGGKMLAKLTMAGARLGTPVYMSPEQARGLKIDPRSDIYSLGLVFYEMLAGQTAFKGNYESIVHQQIFQNPTPPRQVNLEVPKTLDDLVMWMITKDPDDRPNLEKIAEVLERYPYSEEQSVQAEMPSNLTVVVNASQGVLRTLDLEGELQNSFGKVGIGKNQFFAVPQAIAIDDLGNYYLAILEHSSVDSKQMIHKLSSSGELISSFGRYGMKPGDLLNPTALTIGKDRIYILDSETQMVQCFDLSGRYLNSFGGSGRGRGLFDQPRSMCVGPDGCVYVLDYGNKQVQRFDGEGNYQTRWAFKRSAEESGLRTLDGFTVDEENNLYISDATGGKVRKISAEGKVVLSFDAEALQDEAGDAIFDMDVDHLRNLYLARQGSHTIHKYESSGHYMSAFETYAPIIQMVVNIK